MPFTSPELKNLALQLIQEAEQKGATLRLLGGLAFYLASSKTAENPVLRREYKDLDFAVNTRGSRFVTDAFIAQSWEPDRHFNALHGQTRMLFNYQEEIQADLFVGNFVQCHKLHLDDRLKLNPATVSLADLLLTKLQIRQINTKDANDIFMLLLAVDFAPQPDENKIDLSYICSLASRDWGWYTTLHDNLTFLQEAIPEGLKKEDHAVIRSKLQDLKKAIEATPKSFRWKMRSQIGRRLPWYDEPEEVNR
jgi:hypothetical protein